MKVLVKVAVVVGVILGLAAGLLPPLLSRSNLDNDALTAARAGSALLVSTDSSSQAEAAARQSIARDPGVTLVGVQVIESNGSGTEVQVSVEEHVHTFVSGWPGVRSWLGSWFDVRSTETAGVGT